MKTRNTVYTRCYCWEERRTKKRSSIKCNSPQESINFDIMKNRVVYIAWGDKNIVDLSIMHAPPWIQYSTTNILSLFVKNLEEENISWGIYICPPNPFDPNKSDLENFIRTIGDLKWKIHLIVDISVEEYWKTHGWKNRLYSHRWWTGLRDSVHAASKNILESTHW